MGGAPKGWTGPKEVDGKQVEGSFRAHQVPIAMDNPEHLVQKVAGQLEEHLHDEQGGKNRIERDAGFERVRFRAHERYLSHGESCLG